TGQLEYRVSSKTSFLLTGGLRNARNYEEFSVLAGFKRYFTGSGPSVFTVDELEREVFR
ncbi:MAG: hypothetical protein GXO03_01910, partial [Aquificae bacterium]|nr:hypothetical protein [Aquificota bacterium]